MRTRTNSSTTLSPNIVNLQLKMMPPSYQKNESIDTANEDWSEIRTVDVETSYAVQLAPADPQPVEVDVNRALSGQDLQSLKKQDPFLYYSIPGVRDATVRLRRGVDMQQLAQDSLRRNCASCPASIQTAAVATSSGEPVVAKVKRCTRVSFEVHTDLLLEDLMDDEMDLEKSFDELCLGRGMDAFYKLLLQEEE